MQLSNNASIAFTNDKQGIQHCQNGNGVSNAYGNISPSSLQTSSSIIGQNQTPVNQPESNMFTALRSLEMLIRKEIQEL